MRQVRLGDVCEKIGSGATPRGGSEVYLPGGIALIRSQNIYNDGFKRDGLAFISERHAKELENVTIQTGDVLLNITGDSVARVCQVPSNILPARVNQHVAIIRPRQDILDARYLRYFLTSPTTQQYMLGLAAAGATRNALTKGMIEDFEIPAPPLSEQCAIARILGILDDKIELNRRMNETLEATARAIFKSWFVDFDPVRARLEGRQPDGMDAETAALFPAAFEDSPLGKIPKGWRVAPLPDVVEINPSRTLPKSQVAPYLDMQNMPTRGHYPVSWSDRDVGSGMKFTNGDTLLARITPCLENGKTAFVDFLEEGQVGWGSTEYIVLHPKLPLPPEYGYYLARGDDLRAHAIQNMTGTSGRQRVPASCFNQYFVVVPSGPIAQYFGDVAKSTMAKIRSNNEQSRTLAAARDALLPKLLSGEVRVRDAEKFVEAQG